LGIVANIDLHYLDVNNDRAITKIYRDLCLLCAKKTETFVTAAKPIVDANGERRKAT
jgi:hypothetical protein